MPEVKSKHINVLELQTVLVAAEMWGSSWRGSHILVRSDNMATVSAINKGSSRSLELMPIIQQLFWLSVKFQFRLTASFLPGRLNVLSDHLSRLHDINSALFVQNMFPNMSVIECNGHLTERSFHWLQECWMMTSHV